MFVLITMTKIRVLLGRVVASVYRSWGKKGGKNTLKRSLPARNKTLLKKNDRNRQQLSAAVTDRTRLFSDPSYSPGLYF